MTTRVRLPDGSYVNVPTDDPKAAAAAAQKHWATKEAAKRGGFVDTAIDFVGDAVDNLTPNWGDEIVGAGKAVKAKLQGKDASAAFRQGQRQFKAEQALYDKRHPNLAWGSTIAGNLAGLAVPASRVARVATMGQKVRQGAKVGAVVGAVSGAGEGDGLDLARRTENAVTSAIPGAAFGAALPVAARAAQNAGRWARTNVPGADAAARTIAGVPAAVARRFRGPVAAGPTAAQAQAHRVVGQRMNEGHIDRGHGDPGPASTPQAIAREVEQRQQAGVPAMVGDTTENMRGLTEYASRGMGPGQSLVRHALDSRKATEGQRVRQHVQSTMPTTDDPLAFVAQQQRQAREAAAPLYREAYEQPVFRTDAIQGIEQTPAFRGALPQAYDNIRNQIDPTTGRPLDPTALGFRQGAPTNPETPHFIHPELGPISLENGLSTEGYDQVIRAMNDSGRAAANVNPLTGRVQNTTNSVHINARTGDLRRELMGQNDPYRRAVEGFGDDMTIANAFEQGSDVGKLTGHEVNAQRGALPNPAHRAWAAGAGTAMADAASEYGAKYPTANVSNHVRQMLGDDIKQGAIGEMGGDVAGLQERLNYENQGHLNWQGVNGNSKTAQRQQLDSDIDGSMGIPTSKAGVVSRLVGFIADSAAPQFQRDVKERIAQIVTASDAQSVQEAIAAIEQQAVQDASFSDLLQRAGVGATAAYGANVEPTSPTYP